MNILEFQELKIDHLDYEAIEELCAANLQSQYGIAQKPFVSAIGMYNKHKASSQIITAQFCRKLMENNK